MNQVALITEASALRPLPDAGEATLNVQQAMAVLMAHQAAEFEAGRPEREANMRQLALASRDSSRGLIRTALERVAEGNAPEASRLLKNARWYRRHYLRTMP